MRPMRRTSSRTLFGPHPGCHIARAPMLTVERACACQCRRAPIAPVPGLLHLQHLAHQQAQPNQGPHKCQGAQQTTMTAALANVFHTAHASGVLVSLQHCLHLHQHPVHLRTQQHPGPLECQDAQQTTMTAALANVFHTAHASVVQVSLQHCLHLHQHPVHRQTQQHPGPLECQDAQQTTTTVGLANVFHTAHASGVLVAHRRCLRQHQVHQEIPQQGPLKCQGAPGAMLTVEPANVSLAALASGVREVYLSSETFPTRQSILRYPFE